MLRSLTEDERRCIFEVSGTAMKAGRMTTGSSLSGENQNAVRKHGLN
jgi:hypothetical protein